MSVDYQQTERDGGLVADLCAKLDLHIGSTEKLQRSMAKALQKPAAQPVFGRATASGLFVTGAPLMLHFNLSGPDQGHFWYVRSIIVGGLTTATAVAGRADVFVTAGGLGGQTSMAGIGLADWRDQSVALPNVAFYGRGEMPLRLNEEIVVIVNGGTNGQMYVAGVQFEDFEEVPVSTTTWDM